MHRIFRNGRLPLRLRPYRILATSPSSGLIEVVANAMSLDSVKKSIPHWSSLSDLFKYSAPHPNSTPTPNPNPNPNPNPDPDPDPNPNPLRPLQAALRRRALPRLLPRAAQLRPERCRLLGRLLLAAGQGQAQWQHPAACRRLTRAPAWLGVVPWRVAAQAATHRSLEAHPLARGSPL